MNGEAPAVQSGWRGLFFNLSREFLILPIGRT